jgi:hypothetical protein
MMMGRSARIAFAALALRPGAVAAGPPLAPAAAARSLERADFGAEPASSDARSIARWVIASDDNRGLAFVIVDKQAAKIFVFRPDGQLVGAAPALLGLARGDHTVPGIGTRKLSSIRPDERTTPAGRFVAAIGHDLKNDVVWVDYDAAISLHRVINTNPRERRLVRLATATSLDNRISYGCINVPVDFYEKIVRPAFLGTAGIVYILPEVRSLGDVFAGYDAAAPGLPRQVRAAAPASPDRSGPR